MEYSNLIAPQGGMVYTFYKKGNNIVEVTFKSKYKGDDYESEI